MSGTDHDKTDDWSGPQPGFVLVHPQMGENIGAAARAMWNFGLKRLRLVAPRDGWPNPKAIALASGAAPVLDQVQLFPTTIEALADTNFVFATTARRRDLTKPVVSPERAMAMARKMIATGQKVAVLFGPERAGLENADIVRANALVSVPVNPAFGSLNLAQSVLLMAYEWRRQTAEITSEVAHIGESPGASVIEIEVLYQHFDEKLTAAGFFWPKQKADSMRLNLRNLLSRLPLNGADVRLLHGVARALAKPRSKPD